MRVLICIATMEPGGAERQVTYLAKGLVDLGHEVHVAIIRGGPYFDRLVASGAVVHFVDIYPQRFRFLRPLLTLFRRVAPDIAYFWQRPFNVFGGMAAALAGIPCLHAERTNPSQFDEGLKGVVSRLVIPWSEGVIANSDAGAAYWKTRLSAGKRVLRIPNIVPDDELAVVAPSPESAGCAVVVGRLDADKNVMTLLAAAERLRREGVVIPILVAGEGPQAADLQAFVERHGLRDQVTLCGFRHDVWPLMKGARVFVSLSLYEGEPNAVLEAFMLGCRLVLSDIAAHRSIVSPAHAIFVDPHSDADVAEALKVALRSSAAPERPAQDTALIAERLAPAVSQKHVDLFQQLLGTRLWERPALKKTT
jgi:glycosyltransferase involved in cell wall biosynthesis